MTATPYTLDVIPFPDKSMRYFERALIETTPASPARIRAILRQCWRDIHNLGDSMPDAPQTTETFVRAREFLARLLPHLTSVSNVAMVAQLISDVRAEERKRCAGIVLAFLRWRGVERPWPADLERIIAKIENGEPT